MVAAHIDAATAAEIKAERAAMFQDAKLLGQTLFLTLSRDDDGDGDAVEIPAQEVLVLLSDSGSTRRGDAAQVTTNTGELRKEAPFNVRNGDRFTLPPTHPGLAGVNCYVSEPPVDAGAYIRAPFRVEG